MKTITKHIKLIILTGFILLLQLQITKKAAAKEIQKDTVAEQLLVKINNGLNNNSLDSVYYYAKKLMNFSRGSSLTHYKGQSNVAMANYYYLKEINDSALLYYKKAIQIFNKYNHDTLGAQAQGRIAIAYRHMGNYDSAISYYTNALDFFTNTNNATWSGVISDHLGLIYMKQGNYYKALENMQQAINSFQETENIQGIGSVYNKMGIIFKETEDYKKAEEAYKNAIDVLIKIDETPELGMAYNNLASIYLNKGETTLAVESLEKGKLIFERTDYFMGFAGYYSVLSEYYNNKVPPSYDKVIESSSKGLSIAEKYNNDRQYAHATNVLGTAYLKTNQIDKAEKILKLGLMVSERNEYNSISVLITKLLSEVYEKKQQPKQALKYLQKYVVYNDSLIDEEKIKELTRLDLRFKFRQEQITDSLENLQREQSINLLHKNELYNQKRSNLIFIFISIIIFIVAIFIFYSFRRSKKQSTILSIKNSQIEKSLFEKEILLKEVHHRVKNNFQTVSSLLELQLGEVQDMNAIKSIIEGQNRIKAMALIHQKLYQSDDISKVNLQEYMEQLIRQIASLYSLIKIETNIKVHDVNLDIDTAIPLGLIINELITNAFKYAFSADRKNTLSITIESKNSSNYILKVSDNGDGLPEGIDFSINSSLGLRLIKLLSKQLHGKVNYSYDDGSVFEIIFKDENQRKEIE